MLLSGVANLFLIRKFLEMLRFFVFYGVVRKIISNNTFLARQISLAIKWSILVLIKSAWLRVCSQEKK